MARSSCFRGFRLRWFKHAHMCLHCRLSAVSATDAYSAHCVMTVHLEPHSEKIIVIVITHASLTHTLTHTLSRTEREQATGFMTSNLIEMPRYPTMYEYMK